ncbi:hypothetical protein CISIN_1g023781mg [Citrus sinensis]|uniref:Uncharacterized protein n=1 Tax=Citrus sinensis TaxID=2711 RepID=A0A067DHW5_CITSI|nr:hypothetical protein CISIN_1g023781mg [Citrus sinensis]
MGRLQIRPPNGTVPNPFLSQQSLEDLLLDAANLSDSSSDDDDSNNKTQLAKEESKLEKEIIKVILSGKIDSLKPNSGQAVTIGEHHICLGFHEETGSDYRVWEWHGHIMLFDEDNGYTPEYIYGNYFERLQGKVPRGSGGSVVEKKKEKEEEEEEEEKVGNLGLRELIDGGDSNAGRILHRNMKNGSPSEDSLLCSFTWLYLVIKAALRHPISISQVKIEQQSTDYAQTLEQFQGLSVVFHNLSFFIACLTAYKRLVFCIMRHDHHAQVGSSSLQIF